eukprot:jgi/Mesen1/3292/ME000191S02434
MLTPAPEGGAAQEERAGCLSRILASLDAQPMRAADLATELGEQQEEGVESWLHRAMGAAEGHPFHALPPALRDNVLCVLARAIEKHPLAELLWLLHLRLHAAAAHDCTSLLAAAVKHCPASYDLRLLVINAAATWQSCVDAIEEALAAATSAPSPPPPLPPPPATASVTAAAATAADRDGNDPQVRRRSGQVLDLMLRKLHVLCEAGQVALAEHAVEELVLSVAPSSSPALLAPEDAALLWLAAAHVSARACLPCPLPSRLGYAQAMPTHLTLTSGNGGPDASAVVKTADAIAHADGDARVLRVLRAAVAFLRRQHLAGGPGEEGAARALRSVSALMLPVMAAAEGLPAALKKGRALRWQHPADVRLLRTVAALQQQHAGKEAALDMWQQAASSPPSSGAWGQEFWHARAAQTLLWRGPERARCILADALAAPGNAHPSSAHLVAAARKTGGEGNAPSARQAAAAGAAAEEGEVVWALLNRAAYAALTPSAGADVDANGAGASVKRRRAQEEKAGKYLERALAAALRGGERALVAAVLLELSSFHARRFPAGQWESLEALVGVVDACATRGQFAALLPPLQPLSHPAAAVSDAGLRQLLQSVLEPAPVDYSLVDLWWHGALHDERGPRGGTGERAGAGPRVHLVEVVLGVVLAGDVTAAREVLRGAMHVQMEEVAAPKKRLGSSLLWAGSLLVAALLQAIPGEQQEAATAAGGGVPGTAAQWRVAIEHLSHVVGCRRAALELCERATSVHTRSKDLQELLARLRLLLGQSESQEGEVEEVAGDAAGAVS